MITSEEVRKKLILSTVIITNNWLVGESYKILNEYLKQQDKLTKAVKRYFELKAKGIMNVEETNEHRELLKQINEMVGIKE